MRKYEFFLQINNLRDHKLQISSSNYYLSVENAKGEKQISTCKNIVLTEGVFSFCVRNQIKRVQIWNYDKKKKVGTIFLKKQKETCIFVYQFKNFNLRLTIKSFNPILSEQDYNLQNKGSMHTNDSQNELQSRQTILQ